jgi:hypothetical protein
MFVLQTTFFFICLLHVLFGLSTCICITLVWFVKKKTKKKLWFGKNKNEIII